MLTPATQMPALASARPPPQRLRACCTVARTMQVRAGRRMRCARWPHAAGQQGRQTGSHGSCQGLVMKAPSQISSKIICPGRGPGAPSTCSPCATACASTAAAAVKNHWHATLSRKVANGSLANRYRDLRGGGAASAVRQPLAFKPRSSSSSLLHGAAPCRAARAAASPSGPCANRVTPAKPFLLVLPGMWTISPHWRTCWHRRRPLHRAPQAPLLAPPTAR